MDKWLVIGDRVPPLLEKMQAEMLRLVPAKGPLALVGIKGRGADLARRLLPGLKQQTGREISLGFLDITLYRDDVGMAYPHPKVKGTELNFSLEGCHIFLVDDVFYTGRTTRAALDELMDYGRPASVLLAVLVDRGGRELPIRPDVVGIVVEAASDCSVEVRLQEVDGEEGIGTVRKNQGKGR